VIATKCGLTRSGPLDWRPVGRPEYLRQQVELSLRNLGVERIGLQQLHRVDPQVPLEDQVGELALLRAEGKIRHIGLSEVSIEQLNAAQRVTTIASVQNLFNLADRAAEPLLDHVTEQHIAFIPWWPLATGNLVSEGSVLDRLSRDREASPSQLALAWLLRRSPAILPIPGTTSIPHLEDNVRAAQVQLTDEEFDQLTGAVYSAVTRPSLGPAGRPA